MNKSYKEILAENGFEIVVPDIDQLDEEQYKQVRMNWLGASDSSRLLEVNPFPDGDLDHLVIEKAYCESNDEVSKKASVRMGKDIEEIILHKLQAYFKNYTLHKPKDMFGNKTNHLGINYDCICETEDNFFPIEIKAVTKYGRKYYDFNNSIFRQKDGEWLEPREPEINSFISMDITSIAHEIGIPVYYYTQVQQQLIPTNSEFGYLAVLDVDNWDMHIFYVPRNKALEKEIKQRAKDAWLRIKTIRKIHNKKPKE